MRPPSPAKPLALAAAVGAALLLLSPLLRLPLPLPFGASRARAAGAAPAPPRAGVHLRLPKRLVPARGRMHLPSRLIFPAQYLPLAFDHKRHIEEAGTDCSFCHTRARTSTRSADLLLPGESVCLGCHVLGLEPTPGVPSGSCDTCHPGYAPRFPEGADATDTRAAINKPPRAVVPPPHVAMNHKVHADRGIGCLTCHGQVPRMTVATRDNALPLMGTCLTCHDGRRAPMACGTCHEKTSLGKVRTLYPGGSLRPSGRYYGDAHGSAFLKDHALVARARAPYCSSCHTRKECQDCHGGALRPDRVHPSNWILVHPIRARGNDMACASCHRQQTFCVDCHTRAGVVLSGPRAFPSSRLRFHPDGWAGSPGVPRGPAHHSFQAQRNLRVCVSCHLERECLVCHRTRQVKSGLGVNPHPVGFRGACGRRLRANPGTCARCHAPGDPALSRCR